MLAEADAGRLGGCDAWRRLRRWTEEGRARWPAGREHAKPLGVSHYTVTRRVAEAVPVWLNLSIGIRAPHPIDERLQFDRAVGESIASDLLARCSGQENSAGHGVAATMEVPQ